MTTNYCCDQDCCLYFWHFPYSGIAIDGEQVISTFDLTIWDDADNIVHQSSGQSLCRSFVLDTNRCYEFEVTSVNPTTKYGRAKLNLNDGKVLQRKTISYDYYSQFAEIDHNLGRCFTGQSLLTLGTFSYGALPPITGPFATNEALRDAFASEWGLHLDIDHPDFGQGTNGVYIFLQKPASDDHLNTLVNMELS